MSVGHIASIQPINYHFENVKSSWVDNYIFEVPGSFLVPHPAQRMFCLLSTTLRLITTQNAALLLTPSQPTVLQLAKMPN